MNIPLHRPFTCLITKGETTSENFAEKRAELLGVIEAAAADGVELVQIREKALTARNLFELVRESVVLLRGSETRLLVNERVDVAIAAGAAGVHLPADAMRVRDARTITPRGFIIGTSTHSFAEALLAKKDGADLIVFGPVFATANKPSPAGLEILRNVCSAVAGLPVLAIGGIDEDNVTEVIRSGAAGIAAITSLNDGRKRRALMHRLAELVQPDSTNDL